MEDTILFNEVEYPVKDVYVKGVGTVNVSVESLERALNPHNDWTDITDEAEYIDSKIAFYVPDTIMKKSLKTLTDYVKENY